MRTPSEAFQQHHERVLEVAREGLTIAEVAEHVDVTSRTIETWLHKGRTDPGGPYGSFAAKFDTLRADQRVDLEGSMNREELHLLVARAARKGSVSAMRLMSEMLDGEPEPDDEPDYIDVIKAKRAHRRGESYEGDDPRLLEARRIVEDGEAEEYMARAAA